jgi:hypothetical protein
MYYGARYYDRTVGMFISPDTIVPDPTNVYDYNRYMYAGGNPLKFNDPTGHWTEEQLEDQLGANWRWWFAEGSPFHGYQAFLDFLLSDANTGEFDLNVVGAAFTQALIVKSVTGNLPDAIGVRVNGNGAMIIGPGVCLEGLVNFGSGELSYFLSPGADAGLSAGAAGDIGSEILYNLPNNASYRGYSGAIHGELKYGAGGSLEKIWGLPLPNFPFGDIGAGMDGWFFGLGLGGEVNLSVNFNYALEVRRLDVNGAEWAPDPLNYSPVPDTGQILYQAYWGLGYLMFGNLWLSATE